MVLTAPLDAAWSLFAMTSRLTLRLISNPTAARLLRELRTGQAGAHESGFVVRLRMRALRGQVVSVRTGTSDAQVVWETFLGRYHLPPRAVMREDLRCVWDLGCNIGLTMAHFAMLCPRATILGVELDRGNAVIARENVAPWGQRCEVVEGAIWPSDGEVEYQCDPGYEYGARVVERPTGSHTGKAASACSLNRLLERSGGGPVDYVKMDIEGAEREVLRHNTAWATSVRCIKVEIHPPYTVPECVSDLRALGFSTLVDTRHWACVTGVRSRSEEGL